MSICAESVFTLPSFHTLPEKELSFPTQHQCPFSQPLLSTPTWLLTFILSCPNYLDKWMGLFQTSCQSCFHLNPLLKWFPFTHILGLSNSFCLFAFLSSNLFLLEFPLIARTFDDLFLKRSSLQPFLSPGALAWLVLPGYLTRAAERGLSSEGPQPWLRALRSCLKILSHF